MGNILVGQKAQIIKNDLGMLLGNLSKPDLDRILRHTMQNFRKDLLEIWAFPKLNQNRINRMSYFEGIERLDKALEKGKGGHTVHNTFWFVEDNSACTWIQRL